MQSPKMKVSAIDWTDWKDLAEKHASFVITSHMRPDGDALGSELALAMALEGFGKQARIVNPDSTPPNLRFLDPQGRIHCLGEAIDAAEASRAEVLIVVDTGAWAQLGKMGDVIRDFPGPKVVIDHHLSHDDLGACEFRDTQAEAAGTLVLQAIDALEVKVTKEMATALFVAICTDTGWFRFPATTPDTYRIAARLKESGADTTRIYNDLYEQDSLARLHLSGAVLMRSSLDAGGRLIHASVLQEDFQKTGAVSSDTDGIINALLRVGGVEVAALFVELEGSLSKVSLRSRSELDCSEIAAEFGGGGHHAAAGARFDQPLEATRAAVLDALGNALR